MLSTWRRCECLGTKPQESDFVAGLVVESTPIIYSALKSVLSPRRVSVSMAAVFCHQKPEVGFGSRACELGDILFAYFHTPKTGPARRNAILFQAKTSSQQTYRIRSKEERNQLRLYLGWPDFVYQRSSFLTGLKRSVTPKAPHAGAQYMLIDNRSPEQPMSGLLGFPGSYPIGCCMPDELLYQHSDLASELFDLFIFLTGRPFDDRQTAVKRGDWPQVVWDLLETGLRKIFNRKNSGRVCISRIVGEPIGALDGVSFSRASSLLSCTTATDIVGHDAARSIYGQDNDGPPVNRDGDGGSKEPEQGVSLVLIETAEHESEG